MLKKFEKKLPTIDDFYLEALKNLHDSAKELGYATGGMVHVADLTEYGQKFLLRLLNDEIFRQKFGLDAVSYYFNIGVYAFSAGVFYANVWDTNADELKDDQLPYIMENDVFGLATEILKLENTAEFEEFLNRIFDDWLEIMEPYWDMTESRDYIFRGLLIFYQMGISHRLAHMGIKTV